jgi:acetylornithine deacetylase/succinyl-diaminopimelate desuccinylase-like protein
MFSENSIQKIESLIRDNNQEFIENELKPFLKLPSITLNKEGIKITIDFIKSYISSFSEDIKEFEGEINPLLLAKVKGNSKESLLIYMMYDTQPINKEKEWVSNPFGAEVKILPPPLDSLGKCIIARGAYNSKTPLICFLNVIKLLKNNNSLPISLLFLFDGEEETGSPTLLKFLENKKEVFNMCTDAYYPSIKQDIGGSSVLKLGYKGILSLTINIYTKNKEPHSAFSAMIPNPATELVTLLNTIYTNNKFLIKSLEKPYKLSEEEYFLINNLISELNIEKIKKKAGIVEIVEEDPMKAFIDYLFKPTFNISTLKSGFLDKGTKNMVANQALCNIDIRFAHDISVGEIYEEIEEKVNQFAKNSKSHIELIKNIGYEGSRVDKDAILVKSLLSSFERLGIHTEIWPLSAAAAPLSKIKKETGLDFIVGGLGIGGFAHAPNEFVQIDSIIKTRLSNFHFLYYYSRMFKKEK